MAIKFLTSTNTVPEVQINDTGNNPRLAFQESGVVSGGVSTTGGSLVFEASSGIERARILSTGEFGIGTTSPTTKLNVSGNIAVSSGSYLSFIDSNLNYNKIGRNTSVGGIQITTGASATMNLLDNGNVGIGVTSPSEILHVDGNIRINSGTQGYYGSFVQAISSSGLKIGNDDFSGFAFFDNDGNVGIGKTAQSGFKLDVNGNVITRGSAYVLNDLIHYGTSAFSINASNGSNDIRFLAGSLERMRISDAGAIKFNAYGAGTLVTDASGNITVSSGGGADGPYLPLAGGTMTGNGFVQFPDNFDLYLGSATNGDFQAYHDGSNTYLRNLNGDFIIKQDKVDADLILESDDGSGGTTAYLTLDGSATNMKASKDLRFNDSIQAQFGTGADLKIYHDGSNSYIETAGLGTGDIIISQSIDDKDIIFKSDNGLGGVETYFYVDGSNSRTQFLKELDVADNIRFRAGNGGDFQIYHASSTGISFITNSNAGGLRLQSNELRIFASNGSTIRADFNTAVKLYNDDVKKFETTSLGVTITGKAISDATVAADSSTTLTTKGYVDSAVPSGGPFLPLTAGSTKPLSGPLYITSDGSAANGAEIYLKHANNNTTDTIGTLFFGNNADDTLSSIVVETNGANNTSNLKFNTSNAGALATALALNADNSATFAGKVITTEVESTSTLLLDATGDITIDANGGDIILSDDTVIFGTISSSGGMQIRSRVNNADMFLRGVDNGTEFNALTLDMSEGGNATFAGSINMTDNKPINYGGQTMFTHTGSITRIGDNTSSSVLSIGGGNATFTGLVTGIAPVADLNFATKKYVDDSITGGANYLGVWNPDKTLNSGYGNPSLQASGRTDDSGDYFICSADGIAEPNGSTAPGPEPNSWNTGDWVIWNQDLNSGNGQWQKIDNTTVLSGNGTTHTIPIWTNDETIGDSKIVQNSTGTLITAFTNSTGNTGTFITNSEGGAEVGLTVQSRTNRAKLRVTDNDSSAYVVAEAGKAFFGTSANGDANNITVLTSGNVGIGTVTPIGCLDIDDTFKVEGNLRLGDSTVYTGGWARGMITLYQGTSTGSKNFVRQGILGTGNALSYWWHSMDATTTSPWSNNAFRIYPNNNVIAGLLNGKVGIGTTLPAGKLSVEGTGTGGVPTFDVINTSATTFNHSAEFITPNMTDEQNNILVIGRVSSTKNAGYVGWKYKGGSGSNENILTFGHWGADNLMNLDGAGNLGIGTEAPIAKLSVVGAIDAGGKITYTKLAGSLNTTGFAVAGLTTGLNGQSAGFIFTCFGGNGYQRIVYSCINSSGTWFADKDIDEGRNIYDVVASAASGTTITFTFRAKSSNQSFTPRVTVEAVGSSINSSYYI